MVSGMVFLGRAVETRVDYSLFLITRYRCCLSALTSDVPPSRELIMIMIMIAAAAAAATNTAVFFSDLNIDAM